MFEISWSELLILAVVTLIFVGPKDLPKFLNTMGRYAGMVRRQAAEFRAQFDEAMRQAELDALKKEVDDVRSDIQSAVQNTPAPAAPQQPAPVEPPPVSSQPVSSQPVAPPPVEAPPLQVTLPLGRTVDEIKQSAAEHDAEMDAAANDPRKPDDVKGA